MIVSSNGQQAGTKFTLREHSGLKKPTNADGFPLETNTVYKTKSIFL